ncbi:MAG: class I SAM-dependent methyltransferase [Chloroflexota bacterium]|nr:class I SAM-dependent methyltransferase [Chloroflexota bacterium]
MTEENIIKNVREFYDSVGWKMDDDALYQNAQYEDLRPVSRDYIYRCHMRVNRHLASEGRFLLDAGSGPVQYPEYLTYSEDYQVRVCMDLSIVALKEARKRLGDHGFFVVGDVTHLPFQSEVFDGIVSMHAIHHVPKGDKIPAYDELYRTLNPGKQMVVVNGWTNAPLMTRLSGFIHSMKRLRMWWMQTIKNQELESEGKSEPSKELIKQEVIGIDEPNGTVIEKLTAEHLTQALAGKMDHKILVWRSVSVPFLRSVIYQDWGGRFWLKVLYWLEECFPYVLGRVGQYPLILVRKPADDHQTFRSAPIV